MYIYIYYFILFIFWQRQNIISDVKHKAFLLSVHNQNKRASTQAGTDTIHDWLSLFTLHTVLLSCMCAPSSQRWPAKKKRGFKKQYISGVHTI